MIIPGKIKRGWELPGLDRRERPQGTESGRAEASPVVEEVIKKQKANILNVGDANRWGYISASPQIRKRELSINRTWSIGPLGRVILGSHVMSGAIKSRLSYTPPPPTLTSTSVTHSNVKRSFHVRRN